MNYPERLGRFEIRGVIGQGGFGMVYEAIDPRHGEVALKVIDLQAQDDPEILANEKRGAAIQRQLSRDVPEIARIYDAFQEGQLYFVVMEHVRGEDLSKLLERGPLAERRAVSIGIRLCRILEDCGRIPIPGAGSDNRLVHGDIKPENLRIQEGNRVRLLDFGVAKGVSVRRGSTPNVFGSAPYLAPERLDDQLVNSQSDLWSVGVVLYQMVAGALPFLAASLEGLKRRIRQGPDVPPRCPPELREILFRCLELEPARRYPDAAALRGALEAFQRDREAMLATRRTPGWRETGSAEGAGREPRPGRQPESASSRFKAAARWMVHLLSRVPGSRMPGSRSRDELLALEQRLDRLRADLPERAQRLRQIAADLAAKIQEERSLFRFRVEEAVVDRFELLLEALEALAGPIGDLIDEAERLRAEAGALARAAGEMAAPTAQQVSRQWSAACRERLDRIGVTIEGPPDLRRDREQLQKVETEIRAARGLANLAAVLADLGAWSRQMGEPEDRVERLEAQRGRLTPASDPAELQQLAGAVGQLQESLADRARERRGREQAELADRLAELSTACGSQPALAEEMGDPRSVDVSSYAGFRDWTDRRQRAETALLQLASARQDDLRRCLGECAAALRARLEALREPSLSGDLRSAVADLKIAVDRLDRASRVDEILRALHESREVERRLEPLEIRAAAEGLERSRRQQALTQEIREHEQRWQHDLAALRQAPRETLAPEDRDAAEQLLQEGEIAAWRQPADLAERLRRLLDEIEKADRLLAPLLEGEQKARERHANLKRRLQETEGEARRFCPEAIDRVAALVYGMRPEPGRWQVARAQLDLAASLLARAQAHADRLAMAELEDAVKALRDVEIPAIRELLGELGGYEHGRMPPRVLRRRIAAAAERWTAGGSR
jgi:serine/threonine protein kinase